MAIQINDLPVMEDISEDEAKGVFGGRNWYQRWRNYRAGQSGAGMRAQGMSALKQARGALAGALKTVDNVMANYSRNSAQSAAILDNKIAGMRRTMASMSRRRSWGRSGSGSSS